MGLRIVSGAHFLHDFPIKYSLFNTLSIDKVSMSYLFSFLRNQTKCVIKFLFKQLMTSQSMRFIFHQPLKQWLTGTKSGKGRNTKIWISRERKELFRWNKKHFQSFWRAIIWWKNKKLIKIADTTFKLYLDVSDVITRMNIQNMVIVAYIKHF